MAPRDESDHSPNAVRAILKYLSAPAALAVIAVAIHAAYLRAHGADRRFWPDPKLLTVDGLVVAIVFVLLSLPLLLLFAALAQCLAKHRVSAFALLAVPGALAVCVAIAGTGAIDAWPEATSHDYLGSELAAEVHSAGQELAMVVWFGAVALAGYALPWIIATWRAATQGGWFGRAVAPGIGITVCAAVLLIGIAAYSVSVHEWLPDGVGGSMRCVVCFEPGGDRWPSGLRPHGELGRTEAVWLIYEDQGGYWIQLASESGDRWVTRRYAKEELGRWIEARADAHVRTPDIERRRWDISLVPGH